ncbi:hypothetical protein GN958_ATG10363 [Phytophthora infestans]|uniref:Secreted RxLR effector peptide protein n=1 Tax=Phytophthora infestans TaxID=4787 RepID=A0A8S9UIZ2_PHYIN|nr:hypothetical protein GN958_ATG10363 [Phytophthora infestans]
MQSRTSHAFLVSLILAVMMTGKPSIAYFKVIPCQAGDFENKTALNTQECYIKLQFAANSKSESRIQVRHSGSHETLAQNVNKTQCMIH